ncbi:hypothetical protein N0V88_007526 [Collariella sp. IMI 366227]|nr:hypothetical protein N0V88_007526 [Collariella sp. IMI 366227]
MQAPMCRDCFTGTLRGDVTPAGTEETIHGIPTYIAQPPPGVQPSGTVVLITDAIGWKLLNTRALADAYAQRVPCTVYVPDFMNGHAIPERPISHAGWCLIPVPALTHNLRLLVCTRRILHPFIKALTTLIS